jgi:hypothetical protein
MESLAGKQRGVRAVFGELSLGLLSWRRRWIRAELDLASSTLVDLGNNTYDPNSAGRITNRTPVQRRFRPI